VQRLLRPIGGDRSAMNVVLKGWRGGRAVTRCWTVFAEKGDGPWIPSLAVPLLADRLAAGHVAPGARSAAGLLDLSEFERAFGQFAIATSVREHESPPLYARLMGEDFHRLPAAVRAMHEVNGDLGAAGEAEVTRGGWLSRLIGRLFGLPPGGANVPLSISMREDDGVEIWERDFGGDRFSSRLYARDGSLVEQFGPVLGIMTLKNEADGLSMHMQGWRLGWVPIPRWMAPSVRAAEREVEGVFHFDVEIRIPLAGLLIGYRGWLKRTEGA
jgi:hypothetical protein